MALSVIKPSFDDVQLMANDQSINEMKTFQIMIELVVLAIIVQACICL